MHPDRVRSVSLSAVEVTPRTCWIFVEVETAAGYRGAGEATLSGAERAVAEALAALRPLSLPHAGPLSITRTRSGGLPAAAARSALDQALWDIAARRRGEDLARVLDAPRRDRVPVYANINRRAAERTQDAFAACARAAIAAGHVAVKLAPFDEASVEACRTQGADAVAPGLARVAAVRDALGPAPAIMIDCHWRLDAPTADYVVDAAGDLGVHWVECPLPETVDAIAALARLRTRANSRDVVLAGLETAVGVEGFRPFVEAGAYDVVMPDMKYVGGVVEMLRVSELLRSSGVGLSLHNPSGPICHAVSLQLCAVVPDMHRLESQFDETPLFAQLVGTDLRVVEGGAVPVPAGQGIGVELRSDVLARHRIMHWVADEAGERWGEGEAVHGA